MNLSIGVFGIHDLFNSKHNWFDSIIPVIWILFLVLKTLNIYANRMNFIKIKGNQIEYKSTYENKRMKFSSYEFIRKKSNTLSWSLTGNQEWFLKLTGEENQKKTIVELDLKDLGLEHYKKKIENQLLTEHN